MSVTKQDSFRIINALTITTVEYATINGRI
ncbi:Protein of unknown function [Leuconostoc citreum LBAE C11]|nr:Protein of unknown function [Leuconostoc citreum LBAE C11]